MKIILVATGAKGKNVVFVADTLQAYTLEETIRLAKEGKLRNIYAVNGSAGVHLRSSRNVPKKEQLEQLSVSSRQLFAVASGLRNAPSTSPALNRYLQLYETSLKEKGGPFITPVDDYVRILTQDAKEKLQPHRRLVFDAAKKFNIDPYLLGAIIIDELARVKPFEDVFEKLAVFFVGTDVSAGIAQVKIETARGLIQDGYYNPNPNDPELSPENIGKVSRAYLHQFVKKPKYSIFFAAARVRALIDEWKKFADLSAMPEIIATLYHLPYKNPHGNPEANPRGLQISGEFYRFAKVWLQ